MLSKLVATFSSITPLPGYAATKVLGGHLRGKTLYMPQCEHLSYMLGRYEPHIVDVLAEHLEPGMVCYDVGAHIGYLSLTMSQLVGDEGKVISFEASPTNYPALKANIETNQMENMTAIHKAVSNQPEMVRFATFEYSLVGHIATDDTPADGKIEEVEAVSLDDCVFNQGFQPPDLIKIDVEGAEVKVFNGMLETLRFHRPVVLAEVRDLYMEPLADIANRYDYEIEILQGNWDLEEDGLVDLLMRPKEGR
ncbi:MAG: FkbM family methyltransferase [Chloroflexota bacterium]